MEDKVYLCPWGEKYITIFNLFDLSIKRINIEIPKYCYKNIMIKGNEIILFPEKLENGIIVYDIEKGKQIRKICLKYNNICDIVIAEGDKVFILPNKVKEIVVLDLFEWKLNIIKELDIDEEVVWYEVRNISNKKFVIPYTERKSMLYFEEKKFEILKCQHYIDEEISQLLLKLKLNKYI